jgi:hypothetical protein
MTNTRSTKLLWTQRLKRAAWAAACGLLVLAGAQGSVRAEDDNENSIWNLDTRVYQEFMKALGLKSSTNETIEYRERSPLVVPPSRDLPSPAVNSQPPAWPVDPDQKRRKDAAVAKRNRKDPNIELDAAGTPLSPSELNRPGAARADAKSGGPNNAGDVEGNPVEPSKLGYLGGLFTWTGFGFGVQKDEVGTFTREPPR